MSYMEAFCLGSLYQLVTIDESHRTYKMNRQLRMLIWRNIATEELAEVLHHEVAKQRIIKMIFNI